MPSHHFVFPIFLRSDAAPLAILRMENTILEMENNVPKDFSGVSRLPYAENSESARSAAAGTAVDQTVDRSLEGRRAAAQSEIERLVSAGFRVIERTGHLEPKVSDILAEAGLSNQAFYRHFRSKHELLVAVLDEGIRGLGRYLAGRVADAATPTEAVREWIRGMAAQAQDPSGAQASRPFALARGRLAEAFPAEVSRSERQVTASLRDALHAAHTDGSMPAVDADPDAEALYHLMMGWVESRLVEARIPSDHEVARLEAFAMAGLTRPREASDLSHDLGQDLSNGPSRDRGNDRGNQDGDEHRVAHEQEREQDREPGEPQA
jgi:AcrR family transcriptional regulator